MRLPYGRAAMGPVKISLRYKSGLPQEWRRACPANSGMENQDRLAGKARRENYRSIRLRSDLRSSSTRLRASASLIPSSEAICE